ncbi:MAG TPA: SAM-dependent methyltransferase [Pirellulales bacterium]|nr:SAM-dependent methyltransferase [Pirellulales bacterium]
MPTEVTPQPEPALRNISDTARWVAVYRARETQRPDAVFRDPFAARLAGEQGKQIAAGFSLSETHAWSFVARTFLIDRFITQEIQRGVDMVVNLAAGLDARPYRMALPKELRWVEVDLPDLLDYKESVLKDDNPLCSLERVRLNLADVDARRTLFAELSGQAKKVLVLTEGLLIYLAADEVRSLAADLAQKPAFRHWIFDLVSPALLAMLQQGMGQQLDAAGVPLKFGPPEGPDFFQPCGWQPKDVASLLKTAARLKRLTLGMRLIALLPENKPWRSARPWSGICLMQRSASTSAGL